jgi:hypothetical protein
LATSGKGNHLLTSQKLTCHQILKLMQGVPSPNNTLLPAELQSPVELRGVQPGTLYHVSYFGFEWLMVVIKFESITVQGCLI